MLASDRPPADTAFELMVKHLAHSAVELYAAYGLAIDLPSCRSASPAVIGVTGLAVVGFLGQGIRGSLTLLAQESAVRVWMDAAGVADGDPIDALGEFSNMLLCRLKGRLLLEGLSILNTAPTTISGAGLRLSIPPLRSASCVFDGPNWQVSTRLDATFEDGFALPVFCDLQRPAVAGQAIEFGPSSGTRR